MRNTADVTGGKPIAVLLQSISGVSAIIPLVTFYDIHRGKREELLFYFVPDITPFLYYCFFYLLLLHVPYSLFCSPSFISSFTNDRLEEIAI
jgi:hypothetical protein